MDAAALNERMKVGFAASLGFQYVEASKDCLKATLEVSEERHATVPGIMHGGAIMAMADTMGAVATVVNLPPEAKGTTTIESKTNFFAAVPTGQTVSAVTTPLHRGRRTMVWQTRFETEAGKLAAIITQTQMVLLP